MGSFAQEVMPKQSFELSEKLKAPYLFGNNKLKISRRLTLRKLRAFGCGTLAQIGLNHFGVVLHGFGQAFGNLLAVVQHRHLLVCWGYGYSKVGIE